MIEKSGIPKVSLLYNTFWGDSFYKLEMTFFERVKRRELVSLDRF
jgi:hypothetical protein